MRAIEKFPIHPQHLALILIVVALISAVFFFTPGKGFFDIELESREISAALGTAIHLKVRNPTEKDYEDVRIQLATKSPYLTFYYPGVPFAQVNDEKQLTIQIGLLRHDEETRKYVVDITGELPPNTVSMEVQMVVRLLMNDEKTEERIYTLKIR